MWMPALKVLTGISPGAGVDVERTCITGDGFMLVPILVALTGDPLGVVFRDVAVLQEHNQANIYANSFALVLGPNVVGWFFFLCFFSGVMLCTSSSELSVASSPCSGKKNVLVVLIIVTSS